MRVRAEAQTVLATRGATMEEVKTLNLQLSAEHWALLIREAEHDDVLLKDSIAAILLSHVWSLKT
jgi:hypothetical protein